MKANQIGFFYVRSVKNNVPVACVAYRSDGVYISYQISVLNPCDNTGNFNRSAARGTALLHLHERRNFLCEDSKATPFRTAILADIAKRKDIPSRGSRAARKMLNNINSGKFEPAKVDKTNVVVDIPVK